MSPVLLRRWARDEYERMVEAGVFPPGDRVELVDGEIVAMTPQGSGHATAVGLVEDALRAVFQIGYHVRGQRPLALDPTSEPEPDAAVVPGGLRDYRDAHPTTAVLVVEVADATVAYDRDHKGSLYGRAGIPEYWIVNLLDRTVEVCREPIPVPEARYRWGYRSVRAYRPGDTIVPVAAPQRQIAVADLLP